MRSVYEGNRGRVGLFLGLLLFAGTASADLMTNGGFETGDLTGWTQTGTGIFVCGTGGSFACNVPVGFGTDGAPHSGNNALAFGPGSLGPSVQQTLNTSAGQSYDISFWLETCPDLSSCTPNILTASFGGATLLSQTNIASSLWQHFEFDNVTATGSSTVFKFSGEMARTFFLIDDVNVNPSGPSSVPEPSAIALLSTVVGAIGFLARKQRLTQGTVILKRR